MTLDELRYRLFCRKGSTATLPPTSDAFVQHVKRANYQTLLWKMSHLSITEDRHIPKPQNNGWQMLDGSLAPIWTTKDSAPSEIVTFISCKCRTKCTNCQCAKNNLSCTDACGCQDCNNRQPKDVLDSDCSSDEDDET